jgi:hypothetical protein
VSVEEADAIFENFKVMKTSKAWKAFEASGDTSEEGVSAVYRVSSEMGNAAVG